MKKSKLIGSTKMLEFYNVLTNRKQRQNQLVNYMLRSINKCIFSPILRSLNSTSLNVL